MVSAAPLTPGICLVMSGYYTKIAEFLKIFMINALNSLAL